MNGGEGTDDAPSCDAQGHVLGRASRPLLPEEPGDRGRAALQGVAVFLRKGILLKADADGPDHWTDEKIADAFEVSTATVARERRRLCEEGLEVALMPRKPGRPRRGVLDGRAEAHLVALSCSQPPEGRERWSLRLLADRMVELGYADELSYETVRRTLKKTSSGLTSNVSG